MSTIVQTSLDVDKINEIIKKVVSVIGEEDHYTATGALLTMVIMATFPWLEGEEILQAVEDASKLLITTNIAPPNPDSLTGLVEADQGTTTRH